MMVIVIPFNTLINDETRSRNALKQSLWIDTKLCRVIFYHQQGSGNINININISISISIY
jgi:hypothetical protein